MQRLRQGLLALACLAAAPAAQADRSRLEDESDVANRGDCAAEWAWARERQGGAPPERETGLTLACGIGWRSELAATFARRQTSDERLDIVALDGRTSLRARAPGGVGWVLVYGLAGERAAGPWRRSEHVVALEANWQPAPDWLLQASLGTLHEREERRDTTIWTLAAEHSVSERLQLNAELDGDDRRRPLAGVGVRLQIGPEDLALQWNWSRRLGPPRERVVVLALSLEF